MHTNAAIHRTQGHKMKQSDANVYVRASVWVHKNDSGARGRACLGHECLVPHVLNRDIIVATECGEQGPRTRLHRDAK